MHRRSPFVAAALTALAVVGLLPPAASGSTATVEPSITAISPLAGRPSGGDTLTIRGTSLDQVSAVSFGGVRTKQITHTSPQDLSVVVPAHAVGAVAVQLVAGGVTGADSARYRYAPPPTQLRWSPDRTIDPDVGELAGLSCPTPTFCAAVEASVTDPALLTFAPNGRAHRSPLARNAGVPAVSCMSASGCFALNRGSLSRWDGRRWSAFRQLAAPSASLDKLACVAGTRFCLAVGASGATWAHRRSGWAQVGALRRSTYDSPLSCVSARFCLIAAGGRTFRFDGTSWHAASNGLPSYLQYGNLSLACASPTFCMLASEYDTFLWTGARWQSSATVLGGYLDALACPSQHLCILISDNGTSEWRDGHWYTVDSGGPPVTLPALSCPDVDECLATIRSGVAIRRASGWSSHYIERSGGELSDVSCVDTAWCMAVDGYGNAVERADGTWQRPRAIDRRRALSAVSCAGRDFCVAVDGADPYNRYTTPGVGHAVVYSNGSWQAPAVIDSGYGLTDVACASARMCVAVDVGGNAVSWNGREWSPPQHVGALLEAVACPSTSLCVAVGKQSAQWYGGHWHSMPNPVGSVQLTDITCTDNGYCVAGGDGGFYVRHDGVWSGAIHHTHRLWLVQVACLSRAACFGSQDDTVDVWDYAFDGSRVAYSADEIYGPKMSCVPSACVAVSLSYTFVGRPVQ